MSQLDETVLMDEIILVDEIVDIVQHCTPESEGPLGDGVSV